MLDLEKYKTGEVKVCCDSCGNVVDLNKTLKTRAIGRDKEGYEVEEQYFVCGSCGRHYTVTVTDGRQRKMIRERRQLQKQIRLLAQIGARDQKIQRMKKQETGLKNALMRRSAQLKERWRKECGNVSE